MKKIDKKEVVLASIKSLFGAVPFVGTGLNELIDFIPNLRQKRLNKFTEILTVYFQEIQEINIENINTENFSDIFQSIIFRVTKTQSEEKLHHFKNILINELVSPTKKINKVELYLDLISSLSEEEVLILSKYSVFNEVYVNNIREFYSIKNEYDSHKNNPTKELKHIGIEKTINSLSKAKEYIDRKKIHFENLDKYQTSEYYNISNRDFLFYKQSLFSKGLLVEQNQGLVFGGVEPFSKMLITEFGEEFILFIMRSKNTVANNV